MTSPGDTRIHQHPTGAAGPPPDPLTGLPGRERLLERLDSMLREGATPALVILDLDDFTVLADLLGRPSADGLLVAVAERLAGVAGPVDLLARVGGDAFALVAREPGGPEGGARLAGAALATLAPAVSAADRPCHLSACAGWALPGDGDGAVRAPDLLLRAEIALAAARERGPGRVEGYDAGRRDRAASRLRTGEDLHGGLVRHEFRNLYQPVVSLLTGHLVGFESLMRWRHPQRGELSAAAFLAAAERNGLIGAIGRDALAEACRDAAAWQVARPDRPVTLYVNLSPRQVADPDLPGAVSQVLRGAGLEASRLSLEVTETALREDAGAVTASLAALKALGCHIVLDDFGTGHSSLTYLRRVPIDALKIEGAFVADLEAGGEDEAIVEAVLSMARGLGVSVVAEGVETDEQAARLRAMRCTFAQGYRFSRPLEAGAARDLVVSDPVMFEPPAEDEDAGRPRSGSRAEDPVGAEVREALEQRRLVLYGQPVVDLGTGQRVYAEVLSRLRTADGRELAPARFFSAAEQLGLMPALDAWVLERAVALVAAERAAGGDPRLGINLAPRTLAEPARLDRLGERLATAGVPPDRIVLEISEHAIAARLDRAAAFAARAKEIGCLVALDNFGRRFGSLAHLRRLPFDWLKLEGAMVGDWALEPVDRELVRALVGVVRDGMGREVIAQRVEREETAAALRELGVRVAQGHGVARPEPLALPAPARGAAARGVTRPARCPGATSPPGPRPGGPATAAAPSPSGTPRARSARSRGRAPTA